MSTAYIILFTFTVFVASIIPGPSMLLALSHGMQYGIRKTMPSALGNVLVTFIQAAVSIAGLGTVLMASHTLFAIIKWAGVAYLLFLGTKFFFSKESESMVVKKDKGAEKSSPQKMFFQAMLVTAANPKAILFFTAVFPQFIDREGTFLIQSLILLGIICLVAFICFMIYAVGGEKFYSFFSRTGTSKYLKKAFGLSFMGAGIGLATS
jgi:homoserine/homoserine lactone efflux protein